MAGPARVILQMDFATAPPPYPAPGAERNALLRPLAQTIAEETPGLVWKIWTEDAAAGRAGGLYAFTTRAHAEAYQAMHSARVAARGASDIRAVLWDINAELSAITRGVPDAA
ncbi:YdhR family protein [Sediminicoccus sp. KRV36]|uniref:YdhR family protein n=1 Tax=Sediminicoccus sp. KRV36 TaxID=3133721 RepID=UPI00200E1EAA|nr:YdhR family protein [Sediminicoccus rosea]UPY38001.1 YdhR family protein [Sediminicoccus rosea]